MTSSFALHGGNLAYEATRLGCRKDQLLDASASLVPFPISSSLRASLIKVLEEGDIRNYPDCNDS